ncbi:MAG TPA: hypothetical protein VF202_01090 [Trueperaceae bacterium]
MPEHVRAYIYRVLTALAPLLVAYGVVAEGTVGLWLQLAGAVLAAGGTGLAAAYTSTRRPPDDA